MKNYHSVCLNFRFWRLRQFPHFIEAVASIEFVAQLHNRSFASPRALAATRISATTCVHSNGVSYPVFSIVKPRASRKDGHGRLSQLSNASSRCTLQLIPLREDFKRSSNIEVWLGSNSWFWSVLLTLVLFPFRLKIGSLGRMTRIRAVYLSHDVSNNPLFHRRDRIQEMDSEFVPCLND